MIDQNQNEEQQIKDEVKQIYYDCRLKECITKIEELDVDRSFNCHQILQLFKGMSLFKSQQIKEGFKCFDYIIQESKDTKNGELDEIDVIIGTIFQLQAQYYNMAKAEAQNDVLLKLCEDYKSQNEHKEQYSKGAYLFGRGMYIYIDTYREGMDTECFTYLEEAYKLQQEYSIEIMTSLGWMYYKNQQYERSCQCYAQLYEINPRIPSTANNYAIALELSGQLGKAEQLYMEEEKMRGYNQGIICNIALFYSKRGDKEKEKEYYEKLLALNPRTGKICHYYGDFLLKNGKKDEAIEIMKQGIVIDPDYYGNYEQLSDIEFQNQNFQQSFEYAQQSTQIFPQDGYYQTILGERYEGIGDIPNAKQCFKRAIKMKNYYVYKIYSNSKLAFCYYNSGNMNKAMEQFIQTCNYRQVKDYTLDDDIYNVTQLALMMPIDDVVQLIEKQTGLVVTRFSKFASSTENLRLKYLFLYKLEILRTILSIQSYKNHLSQFVLFQSEIIHWDLFID